MVTSEQIADFALGVTAGALPDEVRRAAGRVLIDSIGCCLGGYASPPVEALRSLYGTPGSGDFDATIVGSDTTISAEHATLINGAMIRYLDFNDGFRGPHGGCHPSDLIPAVLAVAEAEDASGAELLEAMTVAYEVQCTGVSTGAIRTRGWDYVTWGVHGATAAVGALMGLSRDELVDALGMAVAANNALEIARLGDVSMWKGVAQAFGAHNAVHACRMARAGMTGPSAVFEGPHGFNEVVAHGDVPFDLGDRARDGDYKLARSNLKPHAACYLSLTAVDALLEGVARLDVGPDDLEAIEVRTFSQAERTTATEEKWGTSMSRETADHSMPYILAIALLEGEIMPQHYGEGWRRDGRVHRLMDRVSVEVDEGLDEYIAAHPTSVPSVIRIKAGGGAVEVRRDYPLGHAENPMDDGELEGKFERLAEGLLDREQRRRTVERCRRLDELDRAATVLEDVVVGSK